MKKFLLAVAIMISTAWILSGCSVATKWADTSAVVSTFCGGSISLPAKDPEDAAIYGVNLDLDGETVELTFVDIASYEPGEPCEPNSNKKSKKKKKDEDTKENSDEEILPDCKSLTKTITEVEDAMNIEEKMKEGFKEIIAKITNRSIAECDVKYTGAEICTRLGGGIYSCTANIVCDGIDVSVHYIFKGFDDLECPDPELILAELKGNWKAPVVEEKEVPKKKELKKEEPKKKEPKKEEPKKEDKKNDAPITNTDEDAPR